MATIYALRVFGGTLILTSNPPPTPVTIIQATARDGIVKAVARDGIVQARSRDGVVIARGR